MLYKSFSELEAAILSDLMDVVADLSKEMLNEVKNQIEQVVYEPYSDLIRQYERLGEDGGFVGSWIRSSSDIKFAGSKDILTASVFSDPSLMASSHPHHASKDGEDRRKIMTEAILEGTDYDYSSPEGLFDDENAVLFNWWQRPRDFWTPVIKFVEMFSSDIVEHSFDKKNITYKKIR